jgi:hypothetical protein
MGKNLNPVNSISIKMIDMQWPQFEVHYQFCFLFSVEVVIWKDKVIFISSAIKHIVVYSFSLLLTYNSVCNE